MYGLVYTSEHRRHATLRMVDSCTTGALCLLSLEQHVRNSFVQIEPLTYMEALAKNESGILSAEGHDANTQYKRTSMKYRKY